MPKGGYRARAGRPASPDSDLQKQRQLAYRLLPREGYQGKPPRFPLPAPTARERAVWRELWRTPQAAAWAGEPWRWHTVGMYARWLVRAEDPAATAAIATAVRQLADQLGLTVAGLRKNEWRLARDELQQRRDEREAPSKEKPGPSPRRMRSPVAEVEGSSQD